MPARIRRCAAPGPNAAPSLSRPRANPTASWTFPALFQGLGARGLTRVLCEGGGRLAGALLAADLVDEVVTYAAGLALGADAVAAVGAMRIGALALAPRFRLASQAAVGGDLRARWVRA